MPLMSGKSPKAFEHNIKAEMNSGKPRDQSLAIAYNMRKRMAKKMAQGGTVGDNEMDARRSIASAFKAQGGTIEDPNQKESEMERRKRQISDAFNKGDKYAKGYADGGMVDSEDMPSGMMGNIADKIMKMKMAKGGMIEYPGLDHVASNSIATEGRIDRSITNLNEHEPMSQNDDFLSDEEDDPFTHHNDFDEFKKKPSRRSILDGIMSRR